MKCISTLKIKNKVLDNNFFIFFHSVLIWNFASTCTKFIYIVYGKNWRLLTGFMFTPRTINKILNFHSQADADADADTYTDTETDADTKCGVFDRTEVPIIPPISNSDVSMPSMWIIMIGKGHSTQNKQNRLTLFY